MTASLGGHPRLKLAALALALALGLAVALHMAFLKGEAEPIRVGILQAQTGPLAMSGKGVIEATQIGIDVLNERDGGLLGRPVEVIVADTGSKADQALAEARRLIEEEKVAAVFGCWTSACRRTVRPVFEELGHLLFYPVQYEGLEDSPNIVYAGAAPNQQILPAVMWAMSQGWQRFFLVGSDYVFPRTANAIIRDYVTRWRGEVVGEAYRALGSSDWLAIALEIKRQSPDAILNTINGDSNVAFFRALREVGVQAKETPSISFSISEPELLSIDPSLVVGDYASWNYFQSVDGEENQNFIARFAAGRKNPDIDGQIRVGDPMESAYASVLIWAAAVEAAGTPEPRAVLEKLPYRAVEGPGGMAYLDPETRHLWKTVRIGRIRQDGQFDIVWTSDVPVAPQPWPEVREREDWEAFLKDLYDSWGGRWAKPEEPGG